MTTPGIGKGALSLLLASGAAQATEPSLDDLMGGFEQPGPAITEVQSTALQSPHQLVGDISFSSAWNIAHDAPAPGETDYRGLSRAKTKLRLQLDSRLGKNWKARLEGKAFYDAAYAINGRSDYTDDVLATYESEAEIGEAWIQGTLNKNLDFKFGRQVIVWGKSDNIRITDVINPLDNREPGITDIEDLRLPVLASRFDWYPGGPWSMSISVIHESHVQKEAARGSDFLPLGVFPLPPGFAFPEDETPAQSLDDTQYALSANGVFQGWDLSFYAADVLDSRWHFEDSNSIRRYGRITMLGSAADIAIGSWLLKSEIALLDGLKYNTTSNEKNRLDMLIGAEYMGFKNTSVSLEIANRHINDYEKQMINAPDFVRENEIQATLRATRSFNHDTLDITWLVSLFGTGGEDGGFQRLWFEYDLKDDLTVSAGVVDYIGGDKPMLEALSDNDRVFAEIKYSF